MGKDGPHRQTDRQTDMIKQIGAFCSFAKAPKYLSNLSGAQPLFVPQSKNKASFLDFLTLEDGTARLSRNVGKELPLHAA